MKNLSQFAITVLLLGLIAAPAHAAFNSLYVFGDALSTTTNNTSGMTSYYYGNRFSNGRVWVEVLAQRQGLTIKNNWSYFDCNSSNLVQNVQKFNITPQDAANGLFVVWVNNSDLFDTVLSLANDGKITDQAEWAAAIAQSQANHLQVIQLLYQKGIRTLIMPNAVDICEVPGFDHYAATNFVRQECIAYDAAFSNTLNQARVQCPGLTIYQPDFFTLLDDVLANAADYGLTNALDKSGVSIDAMTALPYECAVNGLGDNYVFWDYIDPSARLHAIMADVTQQIVSPVKIAHIAALDNGSNQLDIANAPIGLNGFVETCTNLAQANWTSLQSIASVSASQSVLVPVPSESKPVSKLVTPKGGIAPPGPGGTVVVTALQFYRLQFPYQWTWP